MADILQEKRRTTNLVAVCLILGGIVAPSGYGAFRFLGEGREEQRETRELEKSLSELDGLNKTLGEVEAARKATESRLSEAESRLPNSQSMDEFLAQIARVEEEAGLTVDSTTFDRNLKDAGEYKSLPVRISGVGKWDTCYKFLTGLRKMNRLTRLDSLTLEVERGGGEAKTAAYLPAQDPPCQITIDISTFMAR